MISRPTISKSNTNSDVRSSPAVPGLAADFRIVGIGASAGGFEAFAEMIAALPADTGMAFVLIQHLDPTHPSLLAELLARKAILPVREVTAGMAVEPNSVYVMPANTTMTIRDGLLRLEDRAAKGQKHMPIDHFFESLATYCNKSAIGVVLSGTATDGTLGLQAIKAQGGICFAQNEESAKFSGMPASARAAGCVDFSLSPRNIALELVRIALQSRSAPLALEAHPTQPDEDGLRKLLLALQDVKGADFSHYKPSTIHRRIARRMSLKKIPTLVEYAESLRHDSAELDALYQDILIHVTSFFREPQTFSVLKASIFPKLIENRAKGESLRLWIAGCSTGEEAYSIAILLEEYLGDRREEVPVQIFATDLSERLIEHARSGVYSGTTLSQVSPDRLARFFVKTDNGYRVTQSIRDRCTFARHDLIRDPPFSRIDLISCRNVLIYFQQELQQRILATFHYALESKGVLWLGKSETLNSSPDLFTPMEVKGRFFQKRAGQKTSRMVAAAGMDPTYARLPKLTVPAADLQRKADHVVWTRYGHAGVIVDENLQILQFRGDASPYLAPVAGVASLHLLKMVRAELLVELRSAFHQVKRDNAPVRKEGIQILNEDQARQISVDIVPLSALDTPERHFLILFEESQSQRLLKPINAPRSVLLANARLQQELAATRAHLQAIIEEQEAVNDELRAANEEVLSNNEELQSTNEELETAKEELQSTNEELATLTEQQASRNRELATLNDDLRNILDGLHIPIVILGNDQRIRRFTPLIEKVFNIIPADIGRPIQNLRSNLDLDLQPIISRAIDTHTPQEQEVTDVNGRNYTMSVRPYMTSDKRIDGVLIALADTDALKRSLRDAERSRDYAAAVVDTMRQPLILLDSSLRVVTANRSFYMTFQLTPQEVERQKVLELGDGGWDSHDLRNLLAGILLEGTHFESFKFTHVFPRVGRRTMYVNARWLEPESQSSAMILLTMEDLTEQEAASEKLEENRERLREVTAGLFSAQDNERRNISRELHDDLEQRLGLLILEIAMLEADALQASEPFRSQLKAIHARAAGISDDLRNTARRIHPSVVDNLGLPVALRSLCADFSKQENTRIDYHGENIDESIPPDIALCVYRVVQEALRNVVKHSEAKHADVSLSIVKHHLLLSIDDEGLGFDVAVAKSKKGLGLISMEERVHQVRGSFTIRSTRGSGTCVMVQIPLPKESL